MDNQRYLHLVAFNVPYPPNYGGIIDIYFKLKALHAEGVKIILHAFLYERKEADALSGITHEIHYYKRKKGLGYLLHSLPYIVITRQSIKLEKRLLDDKYPVLFEGLHSTILLKKCIEAGKKVIVRTHNIEHNYYNMLAISERNIFRKLYMYNESRKLKKYEEVLAHANKLICISSTDASYFNDKFGNGIHVPAFHQHNEVSASSGKGDYILFHGNLSVPENEKALIYLVNNVLSKIGHRVIIAGKDPAKYVKKKCAAYSNIELISNPEGEEMNLLVAEAHINLLYTYQPTGLKLKLLHSLYGGKYCMANPLMLSGSGLDNLCILYRSPSEAIEKIEEFMNLPFEETEIKKRQRALNEYQNSFNARKIISVL